MVTGDRPIRSARWCRGAGYSGCQLSGEKANLLCFSARGFWFFQNFASPSAHQALGRALVALLSGWARTAWVAQSWLPRAPAPPGRSWLPRRPFGTMASLRKM